MHSLYILISVLFFVTPVIYGQTVGYTSFASGKTSYDRAQQFINTLTTESGGIRVVHSSGGAAGGIVSEGQGYGVFIGGVIVAILPTTDTRYNDALNTAYQLFRGWKEMCKKSTGSGHCQSPFYCPDTPTSTTFYPCLPHWKFTDSLGNDQTGSATDGDIDAIAGMAILTAATANNKPNWWNEVAHWTYASIKQFYDHGCEEKTVGSTAEAILKLGSCWGGLSCSNPSYHSPGHFRLLSKWLGMYAAGLGKPANEITSYQGKYEKLIKSTYKIILSNQNSAGLTTNWYIPNQSDLSKPGSVNSACGGSGTPIDQFGAEAARGVWRAAVDLTLYKTADARTYLEKVVKELTTKFNGNGFSSLQTGGFVNSVFSDWQNVAFIYGPTFSSLIHRPATAISNQDATLAKAKDIISSASINDYYAGSWVALSTMMLSGDIGKAANFIGGTPTPPVAPTPVAPTPPVAAPVAPVTPVTPVTPAPPLSPSSRVVTLKGCSINMYYFEFATSTGGVNSANIVCSDGRTVACTMVTSGTNGKYKCPVTDSKSCLFPAPQINGVKYKFTIPNPEQTCATVNTNSWWVEFVAPVSSPIPELAAIYCADGRYQSCVKGGGKLNCQIKENSCSNPVPIYDGSFCRFPGTTLNTLTSDSDSLSSTDSLPIWTIALIAAGCTVFIVVLIAVIVIRSRRQTQEIV